ncbi:ergothioneine biosynthesis protein EgtB [Scytonema sp. NUACC26]|uniref:ergothioneine biosynthesis protein EgtB n=1 Tax=Scytonema sp. NUACC26 TaxID=3140176 RepID=UPI0034DC7E35
MISELSQFNLKETICIAYHQCRSKTLTLFEDIDEVSFCQQAHAEFSPVGWHLGHIAYTESLWILERTAGYPCLFPQYRKLFAADGLPKTERVKLPGLEETLDYLDTIRSKVLHYLELANLEKQDRLWRFILQHESQHCEIATFLLEILKRDWGQGTGDKGERGKLIAITPYPQREPRVPQSPLPLIPRGNPEFPNRHYPLSPEGTPSSPIKIPAGEFEMGNNSVDALDNERSAHRVYLDTYWIDRYPVTCGQYRVFMEAGGYHNPQWWSKAGWKWLQTEQVTQPLYWCSVREAAALQHRPWRKPYPAYRTQENHPVCGVSWYEAEAYSRFVGKRLPTEAEWEKAASWNPQLNCSFLYSWGNREPMRQLCNHNSFNKGTTPVDAFPDGQSAYGLYDTLGNVWEWTSTWFDSYPGFQSYPYIGYSQVYFDQKHRVLKGGSWATRPWALRCSFRNWYYPHVRQILAGFRCVEV